MRAAKYDLYIEQGATFTRDFRYRDQDNVPIDLTTYVARMKIRRTAGTANPPVYDSEATLFENTLAIDGPNGTVILSIPGTLTKDFAAPFKGAYDIEIEDSDGVVTRLVEGAVIISPGVTTAPGDPPPPP